MQDVMQAGCDAGRIRCVVVMTYTGPRTPPPSNPNPNPDPNRVCRDLEASGLRGTPKLGILRRECVDVVHDDEAEMA